MKTSSRFVPVLIALCFGGTNLNAQEILKQAPAPGSLRPGQTVFVDDHTCRANQIKKITGGSNREYVPVIGSTVKRVGVARTTECVPR